MGESTSCRCVSPAPWVDSPMCVTSTAYRTCQRGLWQLATRARNGTTRVAHRVERLLVLLAVCSDQDSRAEVLKCVNQGAAGAIGLAAVPRVCCKPFVAMC